MRKNILGEKRNILLLCIIIFMIINLVFALNKRSVETSLDKGNSISKTNEIALAAEKDGSISLEESKYFKKYVIECINEVKELKIKEDSESINLYLGKQDVAKLNLNAEKSANPGDISCENSSDYLIIKVKKSFDKNNFAYIDKNNSRNIIVLTSRIEQPFHHTVVLDAGHGGVDKGANYGNIYEKDLTLKIVNFTADELKFMGFKVIQTRDSDNLLSLREVGDVANSACGDVFVSIHINENKESRFKGVTSYYYDPNSFQKNERIRLANTMQKELIKNDDWQDRGVLRQNLAVLRYSNVPSVLLECGFLSNPEDREKLTNDRVLKNLSKNITNGIMKYLTVE